MALDGRPHLSPHDVPANGHDPLIVCELGSGDIRRADQYQRIFARMARRSR
jgi:hypothetical protein